MITVARRVGENRPLFALANAAPSQGDQRDQLLTVVALYKALGGAWKILADDAWTTAVQWPW